MIKMMLTILFAVAGIGVAFTGPKMSAAQRQDLFLRRTGGFVVTPYVGKSIVVVNDANIDRQPIADFKESVFAGLDMPISSDPNVEAGIVLKIVDIKDRPSIMIAPEDGLAEINVARLKVDNPQEKVFRQRIMKELWRSLMYLLGSGNDKQPICLMKQVTTLKELDALQSQCPCPEQFESVTAAAQRFGIGTKRRVTYYAACKQGWAPAPTNDVQKAIWDKVHAMPKNPMKIEFDPKKGR